ncbi:MAG: hypothetical protein V4764_06000 [Burkholderia sp.]
MEDKYFRLLPAEREIVTTIEAMVGSEIRIQSRAPGNLADDFNWREYQYIFFSSSMESGISPSTIKTRIFQPAH